MAVLAWAAIKCEDCWETPPTNSRRRLSCSRCQRRLGFPDSLNDGLQERRQIIGLAAGDQVTVADDLGVHVLAARVDDVVFDGEEAGRLSTFERLRGAKHPGAMTDRGDDLTLFCHGADQADHRLAAAHVVGSVA